MCVSALLLHVSCGGGEQRRAHLDEDLHARATAQAEHQVQRAFLLDVVVSQGAAVFQLLASEDQALLVRGNALLVLDLLLDVLDRVRRLNVEGDSLASELQR